MYSFIFIMLGKTLAFVKQIMWTIKICSAKEQLCRNQTLYIIVLLVKKISVDSKQLGKNNLLFLDKNTAYYML